jgi:glutamine synthetase
VRVVEPLKVNDEISHFEVKSLDHMNNTHLAIAALIVSGTAGLKNKISLPEPFKKDPIELSQNERDALGIKYLPTTIE